MAKLLRVNRDVLAKFLPDHQTVVEFENLFQFVSTVIEAVNVATDTSNFDKVLSASDINVQLALETLDELSHTQIQDIGTNTHPQIDDHIADGDIHFEMLDEDNMASNSNTEAATQQSIKAYVDNNDAISIKSTRTETNNYLIVATDYQVIADGTSNTVTISLPASPVTGQSFSIACINSTFQVDIDFNGNNFYDSSSNQVLFKGENLVIRYNGTYWVSS